MAYNYYFQPRYNSSFDGAAQNIAPASTGMQTPDIGTMPIPTDDIQTPDIGLMPAPPSDFQVPDTGMITVPDNSGTDTTGIGWIPAPPFGNNNNNSNYNFVYYMLQRCMNNMMIIRLNNGEQFWFYPFQIYQGTVNGYRWNQRAGWFNYSIPISDIHGLYCYSG